MYMLSVRDLFVWCKVKGLLLDCSVAAKEIKNDYKNGIVILTSHLLSKLQVGEHITCMDS